MFEGTRRSWWPINKVEEVESAHREIGQRDRLGRIAKTLIAARTVRNNYLSDRSLGEPVWDVLLALYAAHADQITLNMTMAVRASGVPATTAIRWIDHLIVEGLACRTPVTCDRRSCHVCLTPRGIATMEEVLSRQASILEGICSA